MKKIIDKIRNIKFCTACKKIPHIAGEETAIKENQKKFLSLTEGETKIGRIYRLIFTHFNDANKAELWIQAENPGLGNQIPMQMMKEGEEDKLLQFIENSLERNNP